MIKACCQRHLHFLFDPERQVISVKCAQCSRAHQRPVFREWPLEEIIARWQAGEVTGNCAPRDPRFVHWIVRTAP